MSEEPPVEFSPPPEFPQDPEFYRRVLDGWPSPMIVVGRLGEVLYGNSAMVELGGWTVEQGLTANVLDYVHPDDVEKITEAFVVLADAHDDAPEDQVGPWAAIHFRLVSASGTTVPVEVTGVSRLGDPSVQGIIYDVRPAQEQDALRRALTGLAAGEPTDTILGLITSMISLPPLDLDAAVLEPTGLGSYRIVGATNPTFETILQQAADPTPWNLASRTPVRVAVADFAGRLGDDLFAAGYRDFWHVAPAASNTDDTYRIVAGSRIVHGPAAGPIDRLVRANELAGVVLLRARADALLEHAATHDMLTQLPNREGFYREVAATGAKPDQTSAALFIDLDGFKPINDNFGHAAGDRVLETVAARLVEVTRSADLVARHGGDEFAVVLASADGKLIDLARVEDIADRIVERIRTPIDIGHTSVQVTASVGAVVATRPVDIAELLARADTAMYAAKRAGGDRRSIVRV